MNAIKDAVSNAPSIPVQATMADMLNNWKSNNWQLIAVALILGISVSVIVGMFFYYVIKRGDIGKKNVFKIEGLETPLPGKDVTKVSGNNMPSNKDELSMSFWIYVESFDRTGNLYRHVLHRGAKATTDPSVVGPLVYIDKDSNKLHITFKPRNIGNTTSPYPSAIPTARSAANRLIQYNYIKARGGITIDYIPTQRWVHVMVTANRRTNILKAYVDGEEVKTMNGSNRTTVNNSRYRFDLSSMDILGEGDFYVGGKASSTTGIGFDGLVSNLKFFDYVMNKTEVYNEYRRGPIDNIMSKFGMPAYGVRTPIYPLTSKSS